MSRVAEISPRITSTLKFIKTKNIVIVIINIIIVISVHEGKQKVVL